MDTGQRALGVDGVEDLVQHGDDLFAAQAYESRAKGGHVRLVHEDDDIRADGLELPHLPARDPGRVLDDGVCQYLVIQTGAKIL
ncbi:MAG: hypothetical protein Q7T47_07925, partial [Anaerolineales bacterium]|nr:hypothetical protein [Anaerolineales bacterium]